MAKKHSSIRLVLECMPNFDPMDTLELDPSPRPIHARLDLHPFGEVIRRNPLFKELRYIEVDAGDLSRMVPTYEKMAGLLVRNFPKAHKFTLTLNSYIKRELLSIRTLNDSMTDEELGGNFIRVAELWTIRGMKKSESFLSFWKKKRGTWAVLGGNGQEIIEDFPFVKAVDLGIFSDDGLGDYYYGDDYRNEYAFFAADPSDRSHFIRYKAEADGEQNNPNFVTWNSDFGKGKQRAGQKTGFLEIDL